MPAAKADLRVGVAAEVEAARPPRRIKSAGESERYYLFYRAASAEQGSERAF